ncbi:LANO_0B08614g1_1 [Lachancea nothofagi CBS 11611]|uniref:LANO_0B08614g1_1 n=1 Tax=Lachancea nothofagi CBS 11611 TaxID=1266666 RepID=A0A1G4J168_9SACH|nr:LANO_0B08614g1_1 [Lachancea nothofagi CBS 11611]
MISIIGVFSFLLFVISFAIADGIAYQDILSNMVVGNIAVNDGSSAQLDYYSEQPYNATLDVSMASLNNGGVLADAVELYNYAVAGAKWGDATFFKIFIQYNGQAHNYLTLRDVALDLSTLAAGNQTVIDAWADTTTNEKLAALYGSLPKYSA